MGGCDLGQGRGHESRRGVEGRDGLLGLGISRLTRRGGHVAVVQMLAVTKDPIGQGFRLEVGRQHGIQRRPIA